MTTGYEKEAGTDASSGHLVMVHALFQWSEGSQHNRRERMVAHNLANSSFGIVISTIRGSLF